MISKDEAKIVSIPQWCDCCSFVAFTVLASGWFQSHNGAIAAVYDPATALAWIYVSIPQWCDCCNTIYGMKPSIDFGFNPTMVRLLRAGTGFPASEHTSFQSHNGAIAASFTQSPLLTTFRFQSHNGAIAAFEITCESAR